LQTGHLQSASYKFEGVRCLRISLRGGPKRGLARRTRFAMEIQLDEIAEKPGIDPIELRLKQLVEPTAPR